VSASTLAFLLAAIIAGCGKKEPAPPAAAAADPGSAAQPAADAVAAPSPRAPIPAASSDTTATLAAADAALKAREYDRAAAAILVVQHQKQLTEQQAQAAHNQMVRLQRDLAGAIASGDPKAKAAAELLRRSSQN
jgi:hypothetical protein